MSGIDRIQQAFNDYVRAQDYVLGDVAVLRAKNSNDRQATLTANAASGAIDVSGASGGRVPPEYDAEKAGERGFNVPAGWVGRYTDDVTFVEDEQYTLDGELVPYTAYIGRPMNLIGLICTGAFNYNVGFADVPDPTQLDLFPAKQVVHFHVGPSLGTHFNIIGILGATPTYCWWPAGR